MAMILHPQPRRRRRGLGMLEKKSPPVPPLPVAWINPGHPPAQRGPNLREPNNISKGNGNLSYAASTCLRRKGFQIIVKNAPVNDESKGSNALTVYL